MLKRTRVSTSMDMGRLGRAVSHPGIDPRVWCSLAVVNSFVFDKNEGPFCEVTLMPSGVTDTVRVGAIYAGPGFGFYVPLAADDEVLVCYPDGDFDHGGVIVSGQWSKSDAPPDEANSNQADLVLHVQQDKNLRISVSGQGDIILNGGSAKVARVSAGDKVSKHGHALQEFAGAFHLQAGPYPVVGTIATTDDTTHAELEIVVGGADHVKA